jgi:hypothetical protein
MELGPSPAFKFKFRVVRCGELRQARVCQKPAGRWPVRRECRAEAAYCAASDGTAVRENGLRASLTSGFTSVGCTCAHCHWQASIPRARCLRALVSRGKREVQSNRPVGALRRRSRLRPALSAPEQAATLPRPGRRGPEHANLGVTLSAWAEWPFRYRSHPT